MSKKIISTELAPSAVGTYSQGIEVNGIFYFSGQIGLDPATMNMAPDFKGQLEQILKNIDGLLESQSLKRENIIKTTVFMTDLAKFGQVNAAYENYFKAPYPARSTVQVSALPKGAEIEIEVLASKN
ncbi:MAG: reactive intermediate/imine deaminase [Bdellovibrio sp. CG12_big_fil_rev_8_21_14_0_65_39_13]|nr:MAG: reactive intermediate/imine deaminase [Bdellovibrio sp. CG22_combo_CG10-13_8_21_14_all_39_27]PIQ58781.1 MAG: reactive intermediate/imine deaminase [Bdellovibrio sp. CG12_big_fil_rev_8_21_14_0_65_39_13]PIR35538.1 MAG: reactive intermediate/imine deaminase [Bdellovibrio sp. CG11_big_fil_rev_8_21_14_0_20_39_38]